MKKVQTKNKLKGLFGLFASFAMAVGVGVSLAPKAPVVKTEAALANWEKVTAVSDFVSGEKYLLTHGDNSYLIPGAYSGSNPSNGSLVLGTILESQAWTFVSTVANQWRITDGTNYIKIETDKTSGLRTQTSAPSTYFTISIVSNKVRIATSSTGNRAIARYTGGSDWRSYAASDAQAQLDVYKYVEAEPGKTLTSIAVTSQPTKKTYLEGETLDKTGMVVTATYSTGPTENVTDSVVITPSPLTAGTTSVTVSYTYGSETKTAAVSGLTVTVPAFKTVKYEITTSNNLATTGQGPTGSSAAIVETYGTAKQMTSGNSQTLTLSGFNNVKITEITLSARSNASAGAGSFTYSVNNGTTYSNIIAGSNFNAAAWNGSYTASYVDVVKTVNIEVQSTLILKVAATTNSLYVQSYELKWEQMEAAVLSGLTMNKPTVSIVEEETEQLSVTPVPALAPYDVTWSSSNTAAATVDQTGLVTAVASGKGTATITATDKTNTSISAQSVVTVTPMPVYDYFKKITSESQLHFGATYIIGSSDGTRAMKHEVSGNNVGSQETILKNGDIRDQDVLLKVTLEIGSVAGTYALKTISTDSASNGKYLYAAGAGGSNYLKLQNNIDGNASWLIQFDDGELSVVAQGAATRNTMRFNSTNSPPLFSAYDAVNTQAEVAFFLLEDSVNPVVSANMVATEINSGSGNLAFQNCTAVLPILESAYNRLSPAAKALFDSSEEVAFVDARNRLAYVTAWVASQSGKGSGKVNTPINDNNSLTATIIIGVIGLTTLAGYYFLQKKKVA